MSNQTGLVESVNKGNCERLLVLMGSASRDFKEARDALKQTPLVQEVLPTELKED